MSAAIAAACRGRASRAAGPFFATYPELRPLYTAYVASGDPVAGQANGLAG